jgi:hypothetical protein
MNLLVLGIGYELCASAVRTEGSGIKPAACMSTQSLKLAGDDVQAASDHLLPAVSWQHAGGCHRPGSGCYAAINLAQLRRRNGHGLASNTPPESGWQLGVCPQRVARNVYR